MPSSRLFNAVMMLFWIAVLALLALLCSWAPRGGLGFTGLELFSDTGTLDAYSLSLHALGVSADLRKMAFAFVATANLASAGLLLFSVMFLVLGQEREQRQARGLAEWAAACSAFAALAVVAPSLMGGRVGPLLALELAVLGGLLFVSQSMAGIRIVRDESSERKSELDLIIAEHAASHAAFSAQLASMSRRGASS